MSTYNKKTKILIGIAFVLIVLLGLFIYFEKEWVITDPLNATYIIEDQLVSLKDGKSEVEIAPGSASKKIDSILWTPVKGDLNSDGKDDHVMILTENSGGSGTFYYLVAGLSSKEGIIGTNGVFLGDRIAPENILIENGRILINYAERKIDDPMTAQPSIGVSKYLVIRNGQLTEE